MNRPRILRWLRITFSAVCLLVSMLLVALWVRSYTWHDYVGSRIGFRIDSMKGRLVLFDLAGTDAALNLPLWEVDSWPVDWWFIPPGNLLLRIPHRVPLVLFAMLAGMSWLPWSRRFSLRALLIIVTLLSIGLGTVVYLFG